MDHLQIAEETELEAGQTPEAMAGAASKQIDKENGDEKAIHSMDGNLERDADSLATEALENVMDDSKGIIAH